jgi:methylmalonyl-CoA mutase cobalamin-binding subunit
VQPSFNSPPLPGRDGRGKRSSGRRGKTKIRVLIAKVDLTADRGAKFVAHELRNAGMEVIYTGIRQRLTGS